MLENIGAYIIHGAVSQKKVTAWGMLYKLGLNVFNQMLCATPVCGHQVVFHN